MKKIINNTLKCKIYSVDYAIIMYYFIYMCKILPYLYLLYVFLSLIITDSRKAVVYAK